MSVQGPAGITARDALSSMAVDASPLVPGFLSSTTTIAREAWGTETWASFRSGPSARHPRRPTTYALSKPIFTLKLTNNGRVDSVPQGAPWGQLSTNPTRAELYYLMDDCVPGQMGRVYSQPSELQGNQNAQETAYVYQTSADGTQNLFQVGLQVRTAIGLRASISLEELQQEMENGHTRLLAVYMPN